MNMPQLIGSVTVGERGQVVILSEARESMSINAGDKLLVFKAPVDGVLMAVSADIAVVSTALASVFVGQGPKVETATTDGVMRFQNQDEQSQQLLRQVGESATASGTVYTL